jgi:transposase
LRAVYQALVAEYPAQQLVFVDESAANERTKDRKSGWSPRGVPCRVKLPNGRSRRWSILPAIGINGYLEYEIYHGSFNADRFNNFIRKLLTKMTPYPGPRSVLVMDNASVHHTPELRQMCEEAGVVLLYLPPYSPDFNPIETSFSALKAWMRRNRELASEFSDYLEGFLRLAVQQCGIEANAKSYFRACGIGVDETNVDVLYHTLKPPVLASEIELMASYPIV